MAVSNRVLGEGRLIQYQPHLPGADDHLTGMVGVVSPITKQRRTMHAVPVGQQGLLIALLVAGGDGACKDVPQAPCALKTTAVVLAAGHIGANTPVLGKPGPADLIGCASGDGTGRCQLRPEAEPLLDRLVRLELHDPACACYVQAFRTTPGTVPQHGADHA